MAAIWFEQALIGRDWQRHVRIDIGDGAIAAIETEAEPRPDDECHAVGLPGLPNLHSHAFQRAMAGLAEYRASPNDDFWSWREIMYRFANAITPDQLEAIAAFAFVEMLEAGFTRVGEFHYIHHQPDGRPYTDPAEMSARIAAAAAESGIALTLLPVFYAHGGFGGVTPGEMQRRFLHDPESYAALLSRAEKSFAGLPDAVLGIAPHSLRAVTPEELRAVASLLPDAPIHIHVAEQVREVEDCLAWSGQRPVEWLLGHADVSQRWCLVHATHLTEAERQGIALSGAVAGLCPITEANLGDGLFPAASFLNEGGAIGVGTDSNVLISAAEELRMLEYGQRLAQRRRVMLASAERASVGTRLFTEALRGGAQALGAPAGLHVGVPADLASLDMGDAAFVGREGNALLDSWVFASRGRVDCVWRRGRKLVEGGLHREHDRAERRFKRAAQELLSA